MFKSHDIAKRQHRERHQPTERKKWGLLEKKKDYRQRAQDYHKKQAHLALLRAKAAQRNEDEFDFGMIRARTKDGVLVKDRASSQPLSTDAIKLLKTQDEGYIRTLENQERKKVERAKNGIVLPSTGSRTVFVDDEQQLERWRPAEKRATRAASSPSKADREEHSKKQIESLKELKQRIAREKELSTLRQEVDLQRELMKKGPCVKKVDSEGRISYQWLKVRKR